MEHRKQIWVKKLLADGIPRQRIITSLRVEFDMKPEEAEAYLISVKIPQPNLTSSRKLTIIMAVGATTGGILLLAVSLLASSTDGRPLKLSGTVSALAVGASLVLLLFVALSVCEHATKERYRCSRCGHLANRLGHESLIFFPSYLSATYQTYEKTVSSRREVWQSARGENLEEWDSYDVVALTEVCRRCKETRSSRTIERLTESFRLPRDDSFW